jgi:hypothetical protein
MDRPVDREPTCATTAIVFFGMKLFLVPPKDGRQHIRNRATLGRFRHGLDEAVGHRGCIHYDQGQWVFTPSGTPKFKSSTYANTQAKLKLRTMTELHRSLWRAQR